MRKISLLDCTLRDGGYVNDWMFGEESIKGIGRKLAQAGIEFFEVGFIKGDKFNPNRAVFPDIQSMTQMIQPKDPDMIYVGMLDMSAPIPLERLVPYDGTSVDGIRVIFKKAKIEEAYVYCKRVKELGYKLFVNFVGTDNYSDEEFVHGIEKFNDLEPFAMSIVDSFGLIRKKQFMRLVYLADNNMAPGITLCYHAHNNLQQAFSNAESLVELNLKRDLCIDACVFGMGRGAGNLNEELFAEFLNENYDTHYKIEPMLEIMDEYLSVIYKEKFWGYSLPLYLSASTGCHPNYAIYLAEKDTLTVKSFNELLKGIPSSDKANFSKDKAEYYYKAYQDNFVDDTQTLETLRNELYGKSILLLAPGKSVMEYEDAIKKEIADNNSIVIALNYTGGKITPDYIFSSNLRRYAKIKGKTEAKCVITSNVKPNDNSEYVVNYSSFVSKEPDIIDNSGLMLIRLLATIGVKNVSIAGMDGYSVYQKGDYVDESLEYQFSEGASRRNELISLELEQLEKEIKFTFITPTQYKF